VEEIEESTPGGIYRAIAKSISTQALPKLIEVAKECIALHAG